MLAYALAFDLFRNAVLVYDTLPAFKMVEHKIHLSHFAIQEACFVCDVLVNDHRYHMGAFLEPRTEL